MSKYSSANKKVFERVLAKKKDEIEFKCQLVCADSADDIMSDILQYSSTTRPSPYLPIWTGNLLESSGVGVYVHSVLTKYRHNRPVWHPQDMPQKGIDEIWGEDYLPVALSLGRTHFGDGIGLAVVVSAPYALHVQEGRGDYGRGLGASAGYWDRITAASASIIRKNIDNHLPKARK